MRNLKREYKTPAALVTEFECADIITESGPLSETPQGHIGPKTYVQAGSITWKEGIGE